MILFLKRQSDNGETTLGELTCDDFKCFTLEDTNRDKNHDGLTSDEKIMGRTRIPAGVYEIRLRTEGRLHNIYKRKFSFHKGMLWLQNVPNFQYILIHIGNTAADSSGCILVGTNIVDENKISESTLAYTKLYAYCIDAIDRGEDLVISVEDE